MRWNNLLNDQRILELCDEFVPGDPPEYFFDKNPENFSAILELHRSVIVLTEKKKLDIPVSTVSVCGMKIIK